MPSVSWSQYYCFLWSLRRSVYLCITHSGLSLNAYGSSMLVLSMVSLGQGS